MFINIITCIGIVQAIFLSLLISEKSHKPNRFLMAWLFVMGLHLLFYLASFNEWVRYLNTLHILGFSLALVHAPLFFLYCASLIGRTQIVKYSLYHFLPYLVYNIILLFYHFNTEMEINSGSGFLVLEGEYPSWLNMLGIPLAISGAFYPLASMMILGWHQKNLKLNYSFEEEIKLIWLKRWSIAALVFFIIVFVAVSFAVKIPGFKFEWVFQFVSLFMTLYIFFIGYNGLRKTTIFTIIQSPPTEALKTKKDYERSGLDEAKEKAMAHTIKAHLDDKKSFLNEHLTLIDLATELKVSRNHLSQTINSQFDKNFFDLINGYRVEEVKQKMKDNTYKHYSILGIALASGFKSKSSFNKAFRNVSGQTPSEYQKSLHKK